MKKLFFIGLVLFTNIAFAQEILTLKLAPKDSTGVVEVLKFIVNEKSALVEVADKSVTIYWLTQGEDQKADFSEISLNSVDSTLFKNDFSFFVRKDELESFKKNVNKNLKQRFFYSKKTFRFLGEEYFFATNQRNSYFLDKEGLIIFVK